MNTDRYDNFTLSLALVDMIPVIFFGLTCLQISRAFGNTVFLAGSILTLAGGLCKVLWKLLLATAKRDYRFLNRPLFIILMPAGFLLMLIAFVTNAGSIGWNRIMASVMSFPAGFFFLAGAVGLFSMTVFFKVHDKTDIRNNWIEQLTNSFSQAMFFIGVTILL
jgi:hypothetical protein